MVTSAPQAAARLRSAVRAISVLSGRRLQGHQLLAGSGEAVLVTGRKTIINAEVRPVGPAEALHGFEKRRSLGTPLRIVFAAGHENAEPPRLLRARRKRSCESGEGPH